MKNTKTTKKTTPAAGKSEVVVASPTPLVKRKVGRPKKTASTFKTVEVKILTKEEFAVLGLDVTKNHVGFAWNKEMSYLCGKVLHISEESIDNQGAFTIVNTNPYSTAKTWSICRHMYATHAKENSDSPVAAAETPTTITIEVPEGCVIDTENSTATKLVFKKVEVQEEKPKALPKTWEEVERIKGHHVTSNCYIALTSISPADHVKNTFETREQALASIALAQLSILREIYRQGWVPDWSQKDKKYCIAHFSTDELIIESWCERNYFLTFQSIAIAEEFSKNFRDLIEQARPLMS